MASIRKRKDKYHVQVRRKGFKSLNRSFHTREQAETWADAKELELSQKVSDQEPLNPKAYGLPRYSPTALGEIGERYVSFRLSTLGFYCTRAPQKSGFDILAIDPTTGFNYKVQVKSSSVGTKTSVKFTTVTNKERPFKNHPCCQYNLLALYSFEHERCFFHLPHFERSLSINRKLFTDRAEYGSLMDLIKNGVLKV